MVICYHSRILRRGSRVLFEGIRNSKESNFSTSLQEAVTQKCRRFHEMSTVFEFPPSLFSKLMFQLHSALHQFMCGEPQATITIMSYIDTLRAAAAFGDLAAMQRVITLSENLHRMIFGNDCQDRRRAFVETVVNACDSAGNTVRLDT
jgi:hypothetical protein